MDLVTLKDKTFRKSIAHEDLLVKIRAISERINRDLEGERPLFLGVLNGSFMFIADLFKFITLECEVSFVKVASYHGTDSSGKVKELLGLNEEIKGRVVVVVEDIVDTGITIDHIYRELMAHEPAAIKVATLLYKPEAYTKDVPIDYVALEIPNDFIVGYGLDYDGLGRNLKDIYTIVQD